MQLLMGMPIPYPQYQLETNMSKHEPAIGKSATKTNTAVVNQAATIPEGTKETPPDTHGVKFLAVGVSKQGGKFLLVAKDDKHVVLSVRNLGA